MQKLSDGLQIDILQLFTLPEQGHCHGRRDITLKDAGEKLATSTYAHELLATQLSHKKMMPCKSIVHARLFSDYDDWIRHDSEAFLLILSGKITFFSEYYEPINLSEGDSVYYDANMGHRLVSISERDALLIWITAA